MYLSDKPIGSYEDDVLNRGPFAKQMAKALLSYSSSDAFTISLCGKWGCGKTSILNMVKKEIETLSMGYCDDMKPIVMVFNPWNYTSCNQLLTQFFSLMSSSISDRVVTAKEISEAIKKYSSLIDYVSYIPAAGKLFELLGKIIKNTTEEMDKTIEDKESLSYQRKEIVELLKKLNRRIIVIIDDIDRLNNDQIRLIFQLVNSIAGFPNMIYLLSFDKEVVVKALEQEQNGNGEEYLEKIIQVPFYVPHVHKSKILDYLESKVKNILEKDLQDTSKKRYWQNIKENCITPFVSSIRDVNRIINSYRFKCAMLKDDVNLLDLLALTVIEIKQNRLFQWIRANLDVLTRNGSLHLIHEISADSKKIKEKYLLQLRELDSQNADAFLLAVQTLFVYFANFIENHSFEIINRDKLLRERHVACYEHANIYFSLQLEDVPLSKAQIKDILFKYNESKLQDFFIQSVDDNRTEEFIDELTPHISEINEERRLVIFKTMLAVIMFPKANEYRNSKFMSLAECCAFFSEKLFLGNNVEANLKLLYDVLDSLDDKSITALSRIIYRIKCLFGDYGEEERISGFAFVDKKGFRDFEKRYISRIFKIASIDFIKPTTNNIYLHKVWRNVDLETYNKFITAMVCYPENVPNLLLVFTPLVNKTFGEIYDFKKSELLKYIPCDEIYKKIVSLKHSKWFKEFDDKEKVITVEYAVWYEHREVDPNNFYGGEQIKSLITEWE